MAEEKLDLFEFSSGGMAQASASTAKIMRGQMVNASQLVILPQHPPDRFLAQAFTPHAAGLADAAEDDPTLNACNSQPRVHCIFHPDWNRDRADVAAFPEQIYECPVSVSLLKVAHSEPGKFSTT